MTKQKAAASLAIVALGVVIGAGIAFFPSERAVKVVLSQPASTTNIKKSSTPVATPPTVASSSYKDGTYTANGSYSSPAGQESVKVTLTLASGTVTAANVVSEAKDQTAGLYQSFFVGAYKPYVVGKALASIKVSHVGGSSLTSIGFTNALKQIEKQASA